MGEVRGGLGVERLKGRERVGSPDVIIEETERQAGTQAGRRRGGSRADRAKIWPIFAPGLRAKSPIFGA